jgi:predicted dehydrogenase
VDVILDLMIHDLQILHALDPSPIHEIRASGISVLSPKIDMTNARIELESGLVANITASRVASEALRRLRVFKSNSYYSVGYREQEIKGYGLRGEGEARSIQPLVLGAEPVEPLKAEQRAFYAACRGEKVPYVSGAEGRRALATALAVRQAVAN